MDVKKPADCIPSGFTVDQRMWSDGDEDAHGNELKPIQMVEKLFTGESIGWLAPSMSTAYPLNRWPFRVGLDSGSHLVYVWLESNSGVMLVWSR
ncbi:hypothetical protein ACLOJK_040362 [Asimina triloba]